MIVYTTSECGFEGVGRAQRGSTSVAAQRPRSQEQAGLGYPPGAVPGLGWPLDAPCFKAGITIYV